MPLLCAVLLVAGGAAHAQAQTLSMPMTTSPAASAPSGVPVVDAEIRKIDPTKGIVVLRHGEIPNLGMAAMTMGFEVADKKQLKDFKVGDKVRFQADMVDGKPTVTSLKKAH
jgi:Cu(I)/Ag(I) efflux system membrane protein CusA/SilA